MSINKTALEIESNCFQKGWKQIQQKDVKAAKQDLMDALHIISNPTFLRRLYGEVEPKPSEIAAIENVFAKYGITEIWGE